MSDTTETKKIVEYRGIRGLMAAKVTEDDADGITFGTPFYLAGTSELSKTTESSVESHYYDNYAACTVSSTSSDEVGINTSAISEANYAEITGQYYDEESEMLIESGDRETNYYAIGYITKKTDGTEWAVWRFKGTFAIPGKTHATEDDGTEGNGQELTYTGLDTVYKFTKTGKSARSFSMPLSKVDESKFFAAVMTPDTVSTALKTVSV